MSSFSSKAELEAAPANDRVIYSQFAEARRNRTGDMATLTRRRAKSAANLSDPFAPAESQLFPVGRRR